jgi:hypothetical protein
MGLLDMVKGLLGGETAQGLLEATGLGEHVDGLIGEVGGIAESAGVDVDQVTESLGVDVGQVTDVLPGGIGDAVQGVTDGAGGIEPPVGAP